MRKVFLAPHNDDETLFGSFTILREQPHVIFCLRCDTQIDPDYGAPYDIREKESEAASKVLGYTYEQWDILASNPDWNRLYEKFRILRDIRNCEQVWAPKIEKDGHPAHNMIGELALEVWPVVNQYCTYTLAGKMTGTEVPYNPKWVAKKIEAMACYKSQAAGLNCHKYFLRDQKEYIV